MLLFGVRLARLVTWASLWRVVRWAAAVVSVAVGVDGYHSLPHVVSTHYGSLRGVIVTPNHRALRPVAVFLGVPYAAAPVGHLRFMPPKSPPHWSGIRGAETMPPVCPQKLPDLTNKREALKRMPEARFKYLQRLLPLLTNQSEDCLHLNIYTPTKEDLWPSASLERHPVLVYIHGESYEWNSGNPYDGSVLAAYGRVVVVTVNFRLGVLGFLRPTLRESYLSNFGLLDQIAALHWIKENIANFSGDPENITIFGHGTGAALANLLLISPVAHPSKGLFHRAILMSGSALSRWAMTWNPYKYTIQVAKAVGCPLSDEEDDLARCLREKSVEELLSVHLKTPPFTTPLGPVIDGIVIKNEPLESMKGEASVLGKYDLLYGVALAESFHMLSSAQVHSGMSVEHRNTLLRAFITNNFDQYASQIFLAVIEYTKGASLDDEQEVKTQTLETLSDAQITAPVVHMANLHSSINHKSFFYVFNHQSVYGDYPVWQGTVHGEELPYVFGAPLVGGLSHFGLNYSREEVYLSELVMTLWTNFAKTGNPNLPTLHHRYKTPGAGLKWRENIETSWLPYEKHLQQYLHIDLEVMRKHHYRAHQLALWNQVIPNLIKSVPVIPDEEVAPPSTEATPTPSPPAAAGTPISVVILVGICIIIVNCCAMGGVYYQRDKIRHQSRALRRNLRSRKAEDSEEKASDAPSPSAQRKPLKKEGSMSDYKVSNETQSDNIFRAPTKSKESTLRRKHSQSAHDKVSRHETPKSSLKKTKSGHKRHRSEDGIYSEIGRTAEVHVRPRAGGLSKSPHRTNPTVKFNTVSSGFPPKAITKSNTSISSKTSVKSNASSASAKSTTSRSSIKSKSSEKTHKKKNASCQSLPTPERTCGITSETTMAERDDPEGRDNRSPPNQQQIQAPKQKLNYPKLLPDRSEKVHAAVLVQMKPSPALQQTSVSSQDTSDLKDTVHFVYRKKKNPQRDASTDSCDLIETSNINSTGQMRCP
ncbi:neuroligin-4, X-linked-like [Panulirus ornatus]|uniref:neuroligin-4, X-linked-like n=1 Tax=Panulirus ornatus TaxID=150431 RepID=UPI003A88563A